MVHSRQNRFPRESDSLSRPAGFTLMELMLVLAILVALAAFAAPLFQGMLVAGRLEGGAEQVRSLLRDGRRQAMLTGVPHRIDIQPGKGRIRLVPSSDPVEETLSVGKDGESQTDMSSALVNSGAGGVDEDWEVQVSRVVDELPIGVRVEPDEVVRAKDGSGTLASLGEDGLGSPLDPPLATGVAGGDDAGMGDEVETWIPTVEFFPDGSATESVLFVVDGRPMAIEVRVEGLTGDVFLSDPRSLPDWRGESESSRMVVETPP